MHALPKTPQGWLKAVGWILVILFVIYRVDFLRQMIKPTGAQVPPAGTQ